MSDRLNESGGAASERGKSPFTIWFWLAGGLIVAVIVAAVIVAVSSAGRSPRTDASSSSSTPPVAAPSDSVCGLDAGDQSVPTTSAPEAEWALIGKMAAPSLEGAGPGETSAEGFRSCFAHSPVGALLAVANIYVQGSDPQLARPSIEYFVMDGPGKELALARNAESPPEGAGGVQIVGFQFLDYSDEVATIDIVARSGSGSLVSLPTELHWFEGDWRMTIQDNGQAPFPPKQVTSLAGYLPWSGT